MGKKLLIYFLLGLSIMVSSAIGSVIGGLILLKVVVMPMVSQFTQGQPPQPNQQGNHSNQPAGNLPADGQQTKGPGGCTSINTCITYCTSHPTDTDCQRYSNMLPQK